MIGVGRVRAVAIGLAVIAGMAGCKPGKSANEAQGVAKPAEAKPVVNPVDPAEAGSVSGVVRFAGKAPAPVRIDTSMDPACGFGGGGDVYSEQYAVKNERLANVYVYVKAGPSMVMGRLGERPAPVVLDQKGCVYRPHVIAVEAGQRVEFRNEDPTMHNVHTMPAVAGNAPVDVSQGPRGTPQVKQFDSPEVMMPVRCNNHPWMNAFINVSATPWFAVTGGDGKYEMKELPAGDYTIAAVQEKMGEQTFKVTVKPKRDAKADFTFAIQ